MPRRYSDYSDCFYVYNQLSSLGSFITVLRVLLFVIILWESLFTRRSVMSVSHNSTSLEFVSARLPVSFHSHVQSVKVFCPSNFY